MRPLDGVTIVEALAEEACIGERLAVGMAGRIAADLGARVLKIEPPGGDPLREMPPLAFLHAGKQAVTLATDDGGVLARLVGRADALMADHVLCAAHPGAALQVSVSMLGRQAPSAVPASEFTIMALAGVLDLVGDPARAPLRLGGHQAAYAAGLAAFTGLAAALGRPRARDGRAAPETVHVSLLETAIWLNWKSVATAATGGTVPRRLGPAADWPVIRCADGWIALVYQDGDWPGIRALAGDDARLAAPSLATVAGRLGRGAEIAAVVEQHLRGLTRAEIHALALARRLPLGPVYSLAELGESPHLSARGFLATAEGAGGPIAMPRLPVLWNGQGFAPGRVPAREPVREVCA
jgi:crotonobetainyl-CoA:carnitine CoA-transferase CaiB-like acyl-CoA transferase